MTNVRKGLDKSEFLYLGRSETLMDLIDKIDGVSGLEAAGCLSCTLKRIVQKHFLPEWKPVMSQDNTYRIFTTSPDCGLASVPIGEMHRDNKYMGEFLV
jgi:hypothetical protein